jgi:hypothetical protein
MKRSDVTYGQLDQVLRSLGFTCRASKTDPPGRIYQHPESGAMIALPAYPDSDKVFEYHMETVRGELDNFGIADPTAFASKFQKAS